MTPPSPHSSSFSSNRLIDDSDLSAFALSPEDAAAVDALVGAGFDAGAMQGANADRARRAADLLSMLDAGLDGLSESDPILIHATVARIARETHLASVDRALGVGAGAMLSGPDREAVDALVEAGFDPLAAAPAHRPRAERAGSLLSLIGAGADGSAPGDLVARTLARVQESVEEQNNRLNFEAEQERVSRRRLRLSDAVAAAAVLLIGTAVLGPTLGFVRNASRQAACQSNLMTAGLGFGLYADANKDALPMATASPAGWQWWNVGQPQYSNSANLFTIARTNYVRVRDLTCAGAASAEACETGAGDMDWRRFEDVTYSYQNLFAPPEARAKWVSGSGPMVVLVDRSPVTVSAFRGQVVDPSANSANHGERGQNALLTDGSVRWLISPVLPGGDNIWLPQDIEDLIARARQGTSLKGTEAPRRADDGFVGP